MPYYSEGDHNCTVDHLEFGQSRVKHTDYIRVCFAVEGGEHSRHIDLWVTEKTAERVLAQLREHLGYEHDAFGLLERNTGRGRKLTLRCVHNERGYEDWEFPYSDGDEGGEGVLTVEMARRLDRFLKRQEQAVREMPSDDMPFVLGWLVLGVSMLF